MPCRRSHVPPLASLVLAAAVCCACGSDNQRTLQRLGSSKADSATDSAAGSLRAVDSTRIATKRGMTSDLRVRVRDRDALGETGVMRESDDLGDEADGGPPPWAHGHGHGHHRH